MATVLNRTTKQLIGSANTPDYPLVGWIIEPDLSAVAGVPVKYWIITDDIISEMSQPEKDVVDATEAQALKDAIGAESDAGILKAIIAALIKTINIRLPSGQKITKAEMVTAIKGEL